MGRKSVLTRRIERQLLGRVNRNQKFRLSDLLLTARRLVSKATSHRFLKNCSIRNRVAVQDVLTNAQKDRRVNWCRRHLFVDFTKVIFSNETYFPSTCKKFGRIYVYRKVGQKFLPRFVTPTFFRHYATFLKFFGLHGRVPLSFVSIFCNRMDVKKIPKGPPFTFFCTVTLLKNLILIFFSIFLKSPKSPSSFFFILWNQLEFQKAQRVPLIQF